VQQEGSKVCEVRHPVYAAVSPVKCVKLGQTAYTLLLGSAVCCCDRRGHQESGPSSNSCLASERTHCCSITCVQASLACWLRTPQPS
jgi:hypothetical protein